MYDGVDVSKLPANADMYAGYVDGHWPTYHDIVKAHPGKPVVSITVQGWTHDGATVIADVCDVENGDLTPAQGAQWARQRLDDGAHPTIYCSASVVPAVHASLAAAGVALDRVNLWVAHYDNDPTIPDGAVAKQYVNTPDYDVSSVVDHWPGIDKGENVTDAEIDAIAQRVVDKFNHAIVVQGQTTLDGSLQHISSGVDRIVNKTGA